MLRLRATRLALLVTVAAATLAVLSPGAVAQAPDPGADPALDQTIAEDQAVAEGQVVLDDGHVDLGPRLLDGGTELMVHDDAAIPAVWRRLDDTVLRVGDEALQTVPDDPAYGFLGVDPGEAVHIVPQVQRPGVVWVGWNTQDPELMAQIDRGATLRLLGVEGPGDLVVYLQSGVLGDPEVLWRSVEPDPQAIWVEVNTHTHANWVFTAPGVYLVQVEVAADLIDGESIRDVQTIRFAVGDEADPDEAFAAELAVDRSDAVAEGAEDPGEAIDPSDEDGSGGGSVLVPMAVGAAVVLGAGLLLRSLRTQADRRRAMAERDPEARVGP